MTATERREEIMNTLIHCRRTTQARLAEEFGVSRQTLYADLLQLSLVYPIETERGHGGGVRLASWFQPGTNVLAKEQIAVLKEAAELFEGEKKQILMSILTQFTAP